MSETLKFEIPGSSVVLPHESQEDFDELERSLCVAMRPSTALERDLVREMTVARWRLRRVAEMESAVLRKAVRSQMEALGPDADPAEARMLAYAELAESKSLPSLTRHANQLRRAYEKAQKEIESMRKAQEKDETARKQKIQNEPRRPAAPAFVVPPPPQPMSYRDIYNATLPSDVPTYESLLPSGNRDYYPR